MKNKATIKHTNTPLLFVALFGMLSAMLSHASMSLQDVQQLRTLDVPQLTCRQPDQKTLTISLGTPLAHEGAGEYEIVLLARHGLTNTPDQCHISAKGKTHKIKKVVKGTGPGLYGDWALALLDKPLSQNTLRLAPYSLGHSDVATFAASGGTIQVPRAMAQVSHACHMYLAEEAMHDPTDKDQIVLADCPMPAGKSGAPAIAKINNRATLVGLALGYRFNPSMDTAVRNRASVIRLLDHQVLQAMDRLLEE